MAPRTSRTRLQEQNRRFRLARKITRCEQRCAYCGLESASERRSDNRPALSAPVLKNKKGSPVLEGRGEAARKLLLSTKNREAWSLFSEELVIRIIFSPDASPRPSGTGPIWNHQEPALKRRPIINTSPPTSPRLRRAGRGGRFSVPKRANMYRLLGGFRARKSHPAAAG